ncbi:nuclear fragile X mental retardation-interacting protein [Ceratobasidium sp. AG-Ba]|nr:nuclear fragile X mental retardation-interacting protein [Ceratobasidium sp. AG-Ba]
MSWNASYGWQTSQSTFHPNGSGVNMQPHYANAYYAPGGYYSQSAAPQPAQITVPSPGFARNQPMTSLVPIHMRNRVGPARCGHEGCQFAGSHKDVEIHKMDRHLIFPPGWEENQARKKRKRGKGPGEDEDEGYVDEEAQFRTSGSVAILGTDTKLDTPEAIAAWLQERKKRWPSAKRVAEKVQSRKEALERGQMIAEPRKLHSSNRDNAHDRGTSRHGRGRPRGRGRDTTQRESALGRGPNHSDQISSSPSSSMVSSLDSDSTSDSDSSAESKDDSGSDMDPVLDALSSKVAPNECIDIDLADANGEQSLEGARQPDTQMRKQPFKKRAAQPPKTAYNPFDQRPNLLRNLLKPDIQATVSNLSQAIRFLVANDFLDNVELKPGEASDVLVQPLDDSSQSPSNKTQ